MGNSIPDYIRDGSGCKSVERYVERAGHIQLFAGRRGSVKCGHTTTDINVRSDGHDELRDDDCNRTANSE